MLEKQKFMAEKLQELHKNNKMFVIPNAWDVASAYIYEKQGFSAVATTSAGIAYSLGYPDGEKISLEDLVYLTKKFLIESIYHSLLILNEVTLKIFKMLKKMPKN